MRFATVHLVLDGRRLTLDKHRLVERTHPASYRHTPLLSKAGYVADASAFRKWQIETSVQYLGNGGRLLG